MSLKNFMVLEGMMIVSAIILMVLYNIFGIDKTLKRLKQKHWSIRVMIIFSFSITLSIICSILIKVFSLSIYEYIIRGIFLGFVISIIPYLVDTNNRKKIKS